jgi:hypothetical protein
MIWGVYGISQNPEFRNFEAADFVYTELNASVRALGGNNAKIERNVLVERGLGQNLKRLDVEAAITLAIVCGQMVEKDDFVAFKTSREHLPLPSEQRRQTRNVRDGVNETRRRAHAIVGDIVERRTDGRPKHAEPLDAFVEALELLGYGMFRTWWVQAVAELRSSSAQASPLSTIVIAAALVEGVLTFSVRHARSLGLGVFRSKDFDGDSRRWKIDDLVASAASGNEAAILDGPARQQADRLVHTRQRIHVGRLLSESPGGVPDLRPDEARDAKATAELVVRQVLDWLEQHPSKPDAP